MILAIEFKFDNNLGKNIQNMSQKLNAVVLMYSATEAVRLESEMKKNRPWRDRTGMAKATLRAVVSQPNEHTVRITLSHGVSYGPWLELAKQKKYAIIGPTIQKESPNVIKNFQGIFTKLLK